MSSEKGYVHLISGPMYSSKSYKLIKEFKSLNKDGQIGNISFITKPGIDTRDSIIVSRKSGSLDCHLFKRSEEILEIFDNNKTFEYLFVDEFQFADSKLPFVIKELKERGIKIFLSGLDMDFRRINFNIYTELLKHTDYEDKRTALCYFCDKRAKYSLKLGDRDSKQIIDVQDYSTRVKYHSACDDCYEKKSPK